MSGFLPSSLNESLTNESPQSLANTTENIPSLDFSRTDKHEEFGTIFNISRAFWNLPADDSTEAKNEQDKRIIGDETRSSGRGCDIDEMTNYDKALRLFHRISARRRLRGPPGLRRQNVSLISRRRNTGNIYDHLLLTIMTLVPASAIAAGAQYIGHCPANWLLPHLILLIGVLSTVFMLHVIVSLCVESYCALEELDLISGVGKTFGWIFAFFMLIEITLFFNMPASFDTLSKNYCSRGFYFYAAFFNIFTIVVFIIGGLVKLLSPNSFP